MSQRWREAAIEQALRPSLPRSGHCAAALPADHRDNLIVFGGYTENASKQRAACSDAWTFNMQTGRWSPVKYAAGSAPGVRLVSQSVVIGNELYVIGGWDPGHKQDGGKILSDIWVLDLTTYQWRELAPEGETLPPISRFQAVAVGHRIFIHTHRSIDDILVLDTQAAPPKLELRPTHGAQKPSSRGLHSLTAVGESLWLFGGAPKQGAMLGDLWKLDLQDMNWSQPAIQGDAPPPRCSQAAAAAPDSGLIYLFGGAYYKDPGLAPLDDLWILDTNKVSWSRAESEANTRAWPKPRNAAVIVPVQDRFVLYGGWLAFQESYNDTWVLDV